MLTMLTKLDRRWRAVGPAPSFPSILFDTAIDAPQALRDQIARDGGR
jgi:hypothetical protein